MQKEKKPFNPARSFVTPVGRVAFEQVWEPKQFQGKGEFFYSVTLIFESGTEVPENLKAALMAACSDQFGADKAQWPKGLNMPIKKNDGMEKYQGFEPGGWHIKAKSKTQPQIVGPNRDAITDPKQFYSGCYARAHLNASAYHVSELQKGVTFYLNSLQFSMHGDRLGGGAPDAKNVFGDLASFDSNAEMTLEEYDLSSGEDNPFMM